MNDIIINFNKNILKDPTQLGGSDTTPMPKKGDLCLPNNHRGISLLSIVTKVIKQMILNRIQPKVDPYLRPNKNRFRLGRSTTANILALSRLIEGVKERNLKVTLVIIDFKKAFDSIHRGHLLKILRAYRIPKIIVSGIGLLYTGTKAKVLSPNGETEFFEILVGVLQGDTLAPYIFSIMLDYALRKAIRNDAHKIGFKLDQKRSRRHTPDIITDLDFADNIA